VLECSASSCFFPVSFALTNVCSQEKYFELVHPSIPMLDRSRFTQTTSNISSNQSPEFRALSLAVQMLGALAIDVNSKMHSHYYQCAQQILERLETDGAKIGIATVQAWILISVSDIKQLFFSRAWRSSGLCWFHRIPQHICRWFNNPNSLARHG
jgi:hypothetical protein